MAAPRTPSKNTQIDEEFDDDELDRLINETAALGQSWFDHGTPSPKKKTALPGMSRDSSSFIPDDQNDDSIQRSPSKAVGGKATVETPPPIQAPGPSRQVSAPQQMPKTSKHSNVVSSRKQMAMFNQRKQRPEHHLDNNSAHRIVSRSEAPLPLFKPQRHDPVHTFNTMNTFGTMDYRPNEPAKTARATAMAPQSDFYTDPVKASADLKALLEGGMDEDDDNETPAGSVDTKSPAQPVDSTVVHADGSLKGLSVKLLPHQVEGVAWMKGRELGPVKRGKVPKGGILADDMGLGKTLQTLSLILSHQKPTAVLPKNKKHYADIDKATLVVAPLALIRQWEAEIKDKVDKDRPLSVCVHHGPQRSKRPQDLAKYDVVITTYQILVSESNSSTPAAPVGCFGINWWRVVLDEAHTIKNRNAKATKACYALQSEFRWCVTGTPMQNNLDELQSLVCFLRIRPYDDLREWRENIDKPMKNGKGHIAINRLHSLLRCFMKRRTKDILKEEGALQPGGKAALDAAARRKNTTDGKSEDAPVENSTGFRVTQRKIQPISTKFTPAEKRFYDRLEERADQSMKRMLEGKVNYVNALVLLLRLRQACNHPKLVEGKMENDREAVGDAVGKPNKTSYEDMDSLADVLAGVDIQVKICSICGKETDKKKKGADPSTCDECLADLAYFDMEQEEMEKSKETEKDKVKEEEEEEEEEESKDKIRKELARTRKNATKTVSSDDTDDDEDEEEDSWVLSGDESDSPEIEKVGRTTDQSGKDKSCLDSFVVPDEDSEDNDSEDYTDDESTVDVDEDSDDETSIKSSEAEILSQSGLSTAPILASSKIRELLRILKAEAAEHKFIVFSQFTTMLTLIEPFLTAAKLGFVRYDGSMRNDQREASLASLTGDPATRVLLCSLKCGSLGLNLTAATRVVIVEPFWNPFIEEQAIDRVHRLTQTVDVVVYKLTVAGSVEERILQLQERKRALADQAIEGSMKRNAFKLGMKEMLELFRRDHGVRYSEISDQAGSSAPLRYEEKRSELARDRQRGGVLRTPKTGPAESDLYGRRW